tara:strand:+ start:113 stop:643 length:531 start_codon:yes stop_codon:yes gene_type:complete
MKKIITILIMSCAISLAAEESQELKFLGRTVIYENGSWVNPEEPKWTLVKPKSWLKRNYVRHYMQGSKELTESIIYVDWQKIKEAAKTGDKVPAGEVFKVLRLKDTYKAIKTHPEAAAVPVGMVAGSALEGGEKTVMATMGLLKNVVTISLKTIKFVSTPVRKLIPIKKEIQINEN